MSDCKAYRHELAQGWDVGELSRGARAHLASSRSCGEELRRNESLRTLVGGLGKVEAPADFEFRLRARMAAANNPPGRTPLRGLRLLYAFAPVAAAACFLVFMTALYLRQPSPNGAPAAAAVETSSGISNADAPRPARVAEAGGSGGTDEPAALVAAGEQNARAQRVAHRTRAALRPQREASAKSVGKGLTSPDTTLASFGSAPVITGRNLTFTLKAPAEPLRMILRDERGGARVVSVRAVSFGAQEMLARENAIQPPPASKDEGVW